MDDAELQRLEDDLDEHLLSRYYTRRVIAALRWERERASQLADALSDLVDRSEMLSTYADSLSLAWGAELARMTRVAVKYVRASSGAVRSVLAAGVVSSTQPAGEALVSEAIVAASTKPDPMASASSTHKMVDPYKAGAESVSSRAAKETE